MQNGFGPDERNLGLGPLFEFEGNLYCSTGNSRYGAQIWKMGASPTSWTKVAQDGLSGNPNNFGIIFPFEFNEHLYASVWSKDLNGEPSTNPGPDLR